MFRANKLLTRAGASLALGLGAGLSSAVAAAEGVPVHGFADVGLGFQSSYDATKLPAPASDRERLRNFNAGALDFYLTPELGGRVKSLIEIYFEITDTGELAIDLERLQLGYTVADNTTAWLGRWHTPFGIWNTAFHHGAQLQTALSRPRFLEFEDKGGIMPTHSVGAWLNGKQSMASGKLVYDVYAANGGKIGTDGNDKVLGFNSFTDDNKSLLIGASAGLQMPYGLQVGVHGYTDEVTTYGDVTLPILAKTKVNMLGAYAYFDEHGWEVIGEYYHFSNKTESLAAMATTAFATLGSHSSDAWFAQAAYAVNDSFTPYVRFEQASLDKNDSYFNSMNSGISYDRSTVGIRYNVDSRSAVKLEGSSTKEKGGKQLDTSGPTDGVVYPGDVSYTLIQAQYSIAF